MRKNKDLKTREKSIEDRKRQLDGRQAELFCECGAKHRLSCVDQRAVDIVKVFAK